MAVEPELESRDDEGDDVEQGGNVAVVGGPLELLLHLVREAAGRVVVLLQVQILHEANGAARWGLKKIIFIFICSLTTA